MVPFPDAADRLSPSGPFLAAARAGLVRGGSDATREPITYPPALPFIFQRTNTAGDFIQIPLPNFRPGNSILTAAAVTFVEQPTEDLPSLLIQCPLLAIGSNVFAIDNAFNIMGGSFEQADVVRTLTQVALFRPDPAAITQDPVIGWLGIVGGNQPLQIPGGPVMGNGARSWFVAFEIGEDSITQVAPTTLLPFP